MTESLREVLAELAERAGLTETAAAAADQALLSRLANETRGWEDPQALARTAAILETEAIAAYREAAGRGPSVSAARSRSEQLFGRAGACFRLLAELRAQGRTADVEEEGALPAGLDLPFRIAVCLLVARRTSDVRLELRDIVERADGIAARAPSAETGSLAWDQRLLADAFGSFVLLVRKSDGWDDVNAAIAALERLRDAQSQLQTPYLSSADELGNGRPATARLVALFHLAQMVTLVGHYIRSGQGAVQTLMSRLDRHRDHAREAIATAGDLGGATLAVMADLLWAGCRELARNCIWAHVEGLGDQVSSFAAHLADQGRKKPVLELWPSQQEALNGNILDQYRRAVLVQMPTSAGKTLIAEFLIINSRALLPNSTVAYIVPTRALVNQVTRDLRADLGPLGMTVEQAVPAFELDPAERAMLSIAPSVLVTTPEKLSFLIRRNEPSVSSLGLVVVDEAHNLADGQRGARLELLLATIRRDRPGARYLLLSPFLPNAEQLVEWLGDERMLPPIRVEWRPGRRVVATASVEGRRPSRALVLTTLEAAGSSDLRPGHIVELDSITNSDLPGAKTIKASTRLAVRRLKSRGTTLVLCKGPGTAMSRAAELAEGEPQLPSDPFRDAVARYITSELGEQTSLAINLQRGVAYHHAGMSQETRILVECLVRRNLVHIVCGTTTLAQGVNFPISNVVIETRQKGQNDTLSYEDLWNVVGRAGRALVDDAGLVVFPVATKLQVSEWQEFLRGEARDIASQLTDLVDRADTLRETLGLSEIRNLPELSDMLQFLAHAMHVGGAQQTAAELEDLLRSSLVYRQASGDHERADRLVRLCRRYLSQITNQQGQAALSDQTGFSTPSVAMLLARRNEDLSLTDEHSWQPDVLFGPNEGPLTARMRVLGDVPELGLGWESAGTFNPWLAGRIVAGWVNGESVAELASKYARDNGADREKVLADFARTLYSNTSYKASWGLGALATAYQATGFGEVPDSRAPYVPSMVYFGVRTPQAVWMRMAGVPRVAAVGVGRLWGERIGEVPASYAQLRDWISNLTAPDWATAVAGKSVDGADMRYLWESALG